MWCSSSCYYKSKNRWLLNSSRIWEADPQALHSYVRWRTSYCSMWERRQATRERVLKRSQCFPLSCEMECPPQCIVCYDFPQWSSEGRRKVQLPPSPTVLVLRAEQSENSFTWPCMYTSSSFNEVFLIFILSLQYLLLCFLSTLLAASLTLSSNTFSQTLSARPACSLIPIVLLLLFPLIPVSSVL